MKKLYFNLSKIYSYPLYGFLFGVARTQLDYEWLLSNYTLLFACKDSNGNVVLDYSSIASGAMSIPKFEAVPYLQNTRITRNSIDMEFNSIIDFIVSKIDHDEYVYMFVDRAGIPEYGVSTSTHLDTKHDCLVIGYDRQKEVVYCVDYFDKKYCEMEIRFCDFNNAYRLFRDDHEYEMYSYVDVHRYVDICSSQNKYFCPTVNDMAVSYLNLNALVDISSIEKSDFVWGIYIYDLLKLIDWSDEQSSINKIDVRNYFLLKEHKLILLEFAKILKERNIQIEILGFEEAHKVASVISILVTKYLKRPDDRTKDRIKTNLEILMQHDKNNFHELSLGIKNG